VREEGGGGSTVDHLAAMCRPCHAFAFVGQREVEYVTWLVVETRREKQKPPGSRYVARGFPETSDLWGLGSGSGFGFASSSVPLPYL
jgi:hypothetical protein